MNGHPAAEAVLPLGWGVALLLGAEFVALVAVCVFVCLHKETESQGRVLSRLLDVDYRGNSSLWRLAFSFFSCSVGSWVLFLPPALGRFGRLHHVSLSAAALLSMVLSSAGEAAFVAAAAKLLCPSLPAALVAGSVQVVPFVPSLVLAVSWSDSLVILFLISNFLTSAVLPPVLLGLWKGTTAVAAAAGIVCGVATIPICGLIYTGTPAAMLSWFIVPWGVTSGATAVTFLAVPVVATFTTIFLSLAFPCRTQKRVETPPVAAAAPAGVAEANAGARLHVETRGILQSKGPFMGPQKQRGRTLQRWMHQERQGVQLKEEVRSCSSVAEEDATGIGSSTPDVHVLCVPQHMPVAVRSSCDFPRGSYVRLPCDLGQSAWRCIALLKKDFADVARHVHVWLLRRSTRTDKYIRGSNSAPRRRTCSSSTITTTGDFFYRTHNQVCFDSDSLRRSNKHRSASEEAALAVGTQQGGKEGTGSSVTMTASLLLGVGLSCCGACCSATGQILLRLTFILRKAASDTAEEAAVGAAQASTAPPSRSAASALPRSNCLRMQEAAALLMVSVLSPAFTIRCTDTAATEYRTVDEDQSSSSRTAAESDCRAVVTPAESLLQEDGLLQHTQTSQQERLQPHPVLGVLALPFAAGSCGGTNQLLIKILQIWVSGMRAACSTPTDAAVHSSTNLLPCWLQPAALEARWGLCVVVVLLATIAVVELLFLMKALQLLPASAAAPIAHAASATAAAAGGCLLLQDTPRQPFMWVAGLLLLLFSLSLMAGGIAIYSAICSCAVACCGAAAALITAAAAAAAAGVVLPGWNALVHPPSSTNSAVSLVG
ncbi:solute:sodium symporter family protein [Cyclospora cayetanensis]|uniref:Solute:sodium symporter family protein n=1 Tax=Cyclospora cayetanensis TaxID=88456 RepID=A0A1D3CRP1_9EIME|nr:solute:sodium symporter family protein [Cyclospora cayetanensis]